MRRLGKGILLFATVAALLTTSAFPAFAATRKKIRSVSVNIEAVIEPETRFGEEEIEVEVRGGSCSYDYYDIENVGFEWMDEDVPELTIYLRADEGYYFALTKASDVKLVGATYVKATKQDSSETLALRVKLPSMAERVGAQTRSLWLTTDLSTGMMSAMPEAMKSVSTGMVPVSAPATLPQRLPIWMYAARCQSQVPTAPESAESIRSTRRIRANGVSQQQ